MAVLITDDFDRADQTGLGSNWSVTKGGWNIDGNEGVSQTHQDDNLATWAGPFNTADANYSVVGIMRKEGDVGSFAIVGRKQDDENYYFATISTFANSLRLRKRVAGSHTTIGTYNFSPSNSTSYEIEMVFNGNSIIVNLDGEERINETDSEFSSAGDVGIWADDDGVVVESFIVNGTAAGGASDIKSANGVVTASIKNINAIAIASIKSVNGISNS